MALASAPREINSCATTAEIEKEVQAEQERLAAVAEEQQRKQVQAQLEKEARDRERLQEIMSQQLAERPVKDIHIDTRQSSYPFSPSEHVFYLFVRRGNSYPRRTVYENNHERINTLL